MTILRAEIEVEEEVIQQSISELKLLDEELLQGRGQMMRSRQADISAYKKGGSTDAGGCNLQIIIPPVNFMRCDSAYHAEFKENYALEIIRI